MLLFAVSIVALEETRSPRIAVANAWRPRRFQC